MRVRAWLAAWGAGVLLGVPAMILQTPAQADVVQAPAATASASASTTTSATKSATSKSTASESASATSSSGATSGDDEPTNMDEGVTKGNERNGTFVALGAAGGLALFAALWTFVHARVKDRRS